jgi:hypothetical protein
LSDEADVNREQHLVAGQQSFDAAIGHPEVCNHGGHVCEQDAGLNAVELAGNVPARSVFRP